MDATTFLSHLRGGLYATWKEAGNEPQKPSKYSAHIFGALARAAGTAGMEHRGRRYVRELLYDGVWLPQNGGAYRLPQVVIEHENGVTEDHFVYDLRKILMAWAPLRVMIGYVPRKCAPEIRLGQIHAAAEAGRWTYPDNCADLVLVGPYLMPTPRSYLVLYRPPGIGEYVVWGGLDNQENDAHF